MTVIDFKNLISYKVGNKHSLKANQMIFLYVELNH